MFLRTLLAFLLLPGMVAGVVPFIITRLYEKEGHPSLYGLPVLALGLAVLLWCVWAFYNAGKGTLAPWAPPRRLVTGGLYHYSRNPMYIGVLLILLAWALLTGLTALWVYAACVGLAFQLRVVYYEEPTLRRLFGEEWEAYRKQVRRWV